jgi:hypothetical protein
MPFGKGKKERVKQAKVSRLSGEGLLWVQAAYTRGRQKTKSPSIANKVALLLGSSAGWRNSHQKKREAATDRQ